MKRPKTLENTGKRRNVGKPEISPKFSSEANAAPIPLGLRGGARAPRISVRSAASSKSTMRCLLAPLLVGGSASLHSLCTAPRRLRPLLMLSGDDVPPTTYAEYLARKKRAEGKVMPTTWQQAAAPRAALPYPSERRVVHRPYAAGRARPRKRCKRLQSSSLCQHHFGICLQQSMGNKIGPDGLA